MPMLISPAYAQGTGLLDQSALVQFLPLVLIFVVFYFLLIRPQQKKQKDQRAMLGALRRGDRVVTGGGILGTVSKVVSPEEVGVDIASGVRVRIGRSTSPSPPIPTAYGTHCAMPRSDIPASMSKPTRSPVRSATRTASRRRNARSPRTTRTSSWKLRPMAPARWSSARSRPRRAAAR